MSKTTKALAILGVVAGLGVAALPISAMAAPASVSHDVPVQVTIAEELNFKIDDANADREAVILTGTGTNKLYTAAAIKLDVDTTVKAGFDLTMYGSATSGTANALTSTTPESSAAIPGTGITSSQSTSAWGYKAGDDDMNSATEFDAVPAAQGSADSIASDTKAGAVTKYVKFGAWIAAGQEAGTYSGKVTFTAAAKTN